MALYKYFLCVIDRTIVVAESRLEASGTITAAEGSTISYSMSGLVTFTATNRYSTRVKGTADKASKSYMLDLCHLPSSDYLRL